MRMSRTARVRGRRSGGWGGLRPAVVALVCALVVSGPLAAPAAAQVCVRGSGSTFAQIMIDAWKAETARSANLCVEYGGGGSTAGRNDFAQGLVDFASSDVAYGAAPSERPPSRPLTYLPLVAGGTAILYNLKDPSGRPITNLKLSGRTIAKIFVSREIGYWNHPDIVADNPDLAQRLPNIQIRLSIRGPGSGTTAVFTDYLASAAPDLWELMRSRFPDDPIGAGSSDRWPATIGGDVQPSSDGIANYVATPTNNGAIGYAEAGYALQVRLPMAYVKNASGNWTLPTARNVAVALLGATRNPDGTQNLESVAANTRAEAYPISSYNYAIVPTSPTDPYGFDAAKGGVLGQFIIHAVTAGQANAARLGYSPLPPNLVQQALDAVRSIPGAPTPPPLGDWGRYYESLEAQRPVQVEPPPGSNGGGGGGPGTGPAQGSTGATGSGSGSADAGADGSLSTDPGELASGEAAYLDPATGNIIDPTTGQVIASAAEALELEPTSAEGVYGFRTSRKPLILVGVALGLGLIFPALVGQPIAKRLARRRERDVGRGRTDLDADPPPPPLLPSPEVVDGLPVYASR